MIAAHISTRWLILFFSLFVILTLSSGRSSFAQTDNDKRAKQLENERKKLERLRDPASRAASLMKIADIILTYVRDAITENDLPKLKSCTDEYRQSVREARDIMMDSGLDPLRKPKGYKIIELSTRVHLRLLEDSKRRLAVDDRQEVEEAIDEVSKIRSEMLDALFP